MILGLHYYFSIYPSDLILDYSESHFIIGLLVFQHREILTDIHLYKFSCLSISARSICLAADHELPKEPPFQLFIYFFGSPKKHVPMTEDKQDVEGDVTLFFTMPRHSWDRHITSIFLSSKQTKINQTPSDQDAMQHTESILSQAFRVPVIYHGPNFYILHSIKQDLADFRIAASGVRLIF